MSEVSNSEESLSPQEKTTKDYFRQSFRFAQDSFSAQLNMFSWLAARGYLDPPLNIPEEAPPYIVALEPPPYHKSQTKTIIEKTNREAWKLMHMAATSDRISGPKMEDNLDMLLLTLLASDAIYQTRPREGRSPSSDTLPDSVNDVHASYFRKFALGKAPTGTPAFDVLLHTELTARLSHHLTNPKSFITIKYRELEKGYEGTHPGVKFAPIPAK